VVTEGGSRGRQGDDDPGLKGVPPGQGKRVGTGDSQCHPAAAGWRGIQLRGACDDTRILSEIWSLATVLRTNGNGSLVRFVLPATEPRRGTLQWPFRGAPGGSDSALQERFATD